MNNSKRSDAVQCFVLAIVGSLGFGAWQESVGAGLFILVVFIFAIEKLFDWK
jgi:hypothetical protein